MSETGFTPGEEHWFENKKPAKKSVETPLRYPRTEVKQAEDAWWNGAIAKRNPEDRKEAEKAERAHRDHERRKNKASGLPSETVIVDFDARFPEEPPQELPSQNEPKAA